jgi:hypothetical protein
MTGNSDRTAPALKRARPMIELAARLTATEHAELQKIAERDRTNLNTQLRKAVTHYIAADKEATRAARKATRTRALLCRLLPS